MKILVTGSSGMIGTELILQLKKAGHFVAGLDRKAPQIMDHQMDEFYPVDMLDQWSLEHIPGDFEMVIHLAANARVHNLVENPDLALENLVTAHRVYEYVRKFGIGKVIFASSREVYGNQEKLPVEEGRGSQRNAESNYSATKILGEAYAHSYKNLWQVDTKLVRYSNVYGKYDFSVRFTPKLIAALKKGEKFEIYGEKKAMSFTHLDDCVAGTLAVIDNWDKLPMEINVSGEGQDKLIDVAEMVKKEMKSKSEITIGETLPGEVWNYAADISVLKSVGFKPQYTIEEGMKKAIEWYLQKAE